MQKIIPIQNFINFNLSLGQLHSQMHLSIKDAIFCGMVENYYFEITGVMFFLLLAAVSVSIAALAAFTANKAIKSKHSKKIAAAAAVVLTLATFKNNILVGAMDIVDSVGSLLNIPTIDVIDFLNTVYYFDFTGAAFFLIPAVIILAAIIIEKIIKSKHNKKIIAAIAIVIALVIFKNNILVGAMYVVDSVGSLLNIPTINIIDFLNTLYYL